MIGVSWKNGSIELWDDGVIITVNGKPSAKLTDHEQISIVHSALEDWLREHEVSYPERTINP